MPIEEGQFLLPVGGIVGGIQVNRDPAGMPLEPVAVLRNHRRGQHPAHPIQGPRSPGILKARPRRLRGQSCPGERIPAQCQLVHRIVRQPGGIIAVLVPTGQAEYPLAQQIPQFVLDLPRFAPVWQAGRQVLGQRQPLV